MTVITPALVKATRARRPPGRLEINLHMIRLARAGLPTSRPVRAREPERTPPSPWRRPMTESPVPLRPIQATTVISPLTVAKRRKGEQALAAQGARIEELAQENARLRATAASAQARQRDWIAVAILAAAGRLTVADVLMRAGNGAHPTSAQSMSAAVEAARSKIGPAVANPLLEQAGLV